MSLQKESEWEKMIEAVLESVRYVEFLHGVPVEIPNQTKISIRSGIRGAIKTAISNRENEIAEKIYEQLKPNDGFEYTEEFEAGMEAALSIIRH